MADLETAMRLEPDDHWAWYYRGCILAYLGRHADYVEHCRRMFRQFGNDQRPDALNRLNKTMLLMEGSVPPGELLQSVQRETRLRNYDGWALLNLALANYRCENYDQCLRKAQLVLQEAGSSYRGVAARLLMAMAYERSGDHRSSLAALADANTRLETFPHPEEHDLASAGNLEDWLIAHVLLKEARPLITPASGSRPEQ